MADKKEMTFEQKAYGIFLWGIVAGIFLTAIITQLQAPFMRAILKTDSYAVSNSYYISSCNLSFRELYDIEIAKHNCSAIHGIKYNFGSATDRKTDWLSCTKDPILVEGYKIYPEEKVG